MALQIIQAIAYLIGFLALLTAGYKGWQDHTREVTKRHKATTDYETQKLKHDAELHRKVESDDVLLAKIQAERANELQGERSGRLSAMKSLAHTAITTIKEGDDEARALSRELLEHSAAVPGRGIWGQSNKTVKLPIPNSSQEISKALASALQEMRALNAQWDGEDSAVTLGLDDVQEPEADAGDAIADLERELADPVTA